MRWNLITIPTRSQRRRREQPKDAKKKPKEPPRPVDNKAAVDRGRGARPHPDAQGGGRPHQRAADPGLLAGGFRRGPRPRNRPLHRIHRPHALTARFAPSGGAKTDRLGSLAACRRSTRARSHGRRTEDDGMIGSWNARARAGAPLLRDCGSRFDLAVAAVGAGAGAGLADQDGPDHRAVLARAAPPTCFRARSSSTSRPRSARPSSSRTGPAAARRIGVSAVAKSDPDGHTILVHSNALVTTPAIQANVPTTRCRTSPASRRSATCRWCW